MNKEDFLKDPVKHIDIKSFDSTEIIKAMKDMSFTARDISRAAEILEQMIGNILKEKKLKQIDKLLV